MRRTDDSCHQGKEYLGNPYKIYKDGYSTIIDGNRIYIYIYIPYMRNEESFVKTDSEDDSEDKMKTREEI
jgi:hypothetical protein